MTIERKLRVDSLGRETQFIVPNGCITHTGRRTFEAMLTDFALGYTKIDAVGGWRGTEELITIYRVASLTVEQFQACVDFLLDARWSPAIGKLITDLYVVLHDGECIGYSYEYPDQTVGMTRFHGQVADNAGWCAAACDQDKQVPYQKGELHGTRDTGWERH